MRTQNRRAFTIVELLFTLVILGAGLLGLHGSAAFALRMIGDGWSRTVAATVAQARLERLRASACTSISSGSDETRGVREQWSASPSYSNGTLSTVEIELTVRYLVRSQHTQSAQRSALFRAMVSCT